MLPTWPAFLVIGVFVLQALIGIGLIAVGAVMTGGQSRIAPPERRWPLSQKLVVGGAVVLVLAVIEFVSICGIAFLWLDRQRFA